MQRRRIYEVAKELSLSSEALFKILQDLDYPVKGAMSTVTDEMLQAAKSKLEAEKRAVQNEYAKKRSIGRMVAEKARAVKPRPAGEPPKKKGRKKREEDKEKDRLEAKAVEASVRQTMAKITLGRAGLRRRYRKEEKEAAEGEVEERKVVRLPAFSSVGELANALGISPSEVIAKAMGLGQMVTINQRLDLDTLTALADEFGHEVDEVKEVGAEPRQAGAEVAPERARKLKHRPPVVTVMGHVDHGKTSLLDFIRKSDVAGGETGGITQHIGAYEVRHGAKRITFLDTPGHEAFTAMRARGAQVTDLVVLVVAATEGVRPQTVEAIDHAKAARVPIVVAINKMDLPEANPLRVKQDLSQHGVAIEEWGGQTVCVEVSAKKGTNLDKLLEMILLQAEVLELKADPSGLAKGTVVEAKLDRGLGPVATVLIQEGMLHLADSFVAGMYDGKVRAMYNDRGVKVKEAGPSQAVRVQGIGGVPQAGDSFLAAADEREAREIAQRRQQLRREQDYRPVKRITLNDLYQQVQAGEAKELAVVIKGDVDGSVEALSDALFKLSTDKVKVRVIHKGVGAITESDVLLATASNAIIIGFHVRPEERASELALQEGVDIRLYNIIYEALDAVNKALEGMLEPIIKETSAGRVEVRETFKISGVGTIAGCMVTSGTIARSSKVRLLRDNVVVFDGKIASLKRFKEDVRDVASGFECGVGLENFNDIKQGDVIEAYTLEEVKATL